MTAAKKTVVFFQATTKMASQLDGMAEAAGITRAEFMRRVFDLLLDHKDEVRRAAHQRTGRAARRGGTGIRRGPRKARHGAGQKASKAPRRPQAARRTRKAAKASRHRG